VRKLDVAISYGLAGGPLCSRHLRQNLKESGFNVTSNLDKADIIIAHSAGCWLLPKMSQAQLVIYVGMPINQEDPFKTLLSANSQMLNGSSLKRSLIIRLWSWYYWLTKPLLNLRIVRMAKTAEPVILSKAQSVFLANRYDPWTKGKKINQYVKKYHWAFIGLPGDHDDIWQSEAKYIAIISHYAGLLEKTAAK
jgi:hypothetical protein